MSNETIHINNNNFIEYINLNEYKMNIIPEKLSQSTICYTSYLGTTLNLYNIYKYMQLDKDYIVAIKSDYGISCLPEYKNDFKSITQKSTKKFFNQMTIIMNIYDNNFINIKLFQNGSLQISGCKKIEHVNIIYNKLINQLKKTINDNTSDTVLKYVEDYTKLNATKFKINLINTNFGMIYAINREKLYDILIKQNIQCRLSNKHPCVNIKHKIDNNIYVSIFVFQTGNIIITGAKCAEHIKSTYYYIIGILNLNKNKIIKIDIHELLKDDEVIKLLDSN